MDFCTLPQCDEISPHYIQAIYWEKPMTDATTQAPGGPFCWHELMTRDPESAKKFYSELLGWNAVDVHMGDEIGTYTLFTSGEQHLGGMFHMKGPAYESVKPYWAIYVAVADVDDATKRAVELGATVHMEPFNIPDVGRASLIADPTGAVFYLFKSFPRPAA